MNQQSRQWRGVIEEYRDRLDIPEGTPTITLGEGGTPMVSSAWLSEVTGGQVWLKVEGDNPTGSFKDRGMTVALSVAVGQGAEAVVCASTGNTSASMAAYAARARIKPLVLVPQGKIAAGKLAQAIVHGAQVIMVRGNFDDCLQMSRELADKRLFPAIDVNASGTRREELITDPQELPIIYRLRRLLGGLEPEQAYQTLVPRLKKTATNRDFMASLIQQSGNATNGN